MFRDMQKGVSFKYVITVVTFTLTQKKGNFAL